MSCRGRQFEPRPDRRAGNKLLRRCRLRGVTTDRPAMSAASTARRVISSSCTGAGISRRRSAIRIITPPRCCRPRSAAACRPLFQRCARSAASSIRSTPSRMLSRLRAVRHLCRNRRRGGERAGAGSMRRALRLTDGFARSSSPAPRADKAGLLMCSKAPRRVASRWPAHADHARRSIRWTWLVASRRSMTRRSPCRRTVAYRAADRRRAGPVGRLEDFERLKARLVTDAWLIRAPPTDHGPATQNLSRCFWPGRSRSGWSATASFCAARARRLRRMASLRGARAIS